MWRSAPGSRGVPGWCAGRAGKSSPAAITCCFTATLGTGFSDAQCGFKAIRADAARHLLPLTTDDSWFFDTELLVLAERAGLRIHEVPVDWIDDLDSRVKVVPSAGRPRSCHPGGDGLPSTANVAQGG